MFLWRVVSSRKVWRAVPTAVAILLSGARLVRFTLMTARLLPALYSVAAPLIRQRSRALRPPPLPAPGRDQRHFIDCAQDEEERVESETDKAETKAGAGAEAGAELIRRKTRVEEVGMGAGTMRDGQTLASSNEVVHRGDSDGDSDSSDSWVHFPSFLVRNGDENGR